MTKRARHHTTTHDLPFKKHNVLDLRSNERFSKHNSHKFVFKVDSPPVDITTHTTTTVQEEKKYIITTVYHPMLLYIYIYALHWYGSRFHVLCIWT